MNSLRPDLRVMISGGGTGGHIFPAIAIANALKKMNPSNVFLFVGARGRMEMEKVPAAGYKIEGLDITGIQRRLTLKNFMVPIRILKSVMKSKQLIKDFSPDVVVGVGGYASGPLLYAASSMGIPTVIQEQNSYAGITNKILSKKANRIFVAYEGMEKFFPADRIMLTGNPVRESMTSTEGKRDEAIRFFGLDGGRKTILVIGGSLGARTINESIEAGMNFFAGSKVQLIWQTGVTFAERARQAANNTAGVSVFDFIQRMDLAYAAADVIISRAGASSVSELALIGKPVILVPSPNVAEDHQTKNAMALVNKKAAMLVTDADARINLVEKSIGLLSDSQQQKTLGENIKSFARRNAAELIAEEIYSLVELKTEDRKLQTRK